MLSWLATAEDRSVVTIAMPGGSTANAFATLVAWLDAWAEREKTTGMIFYDAQQSYGHDDGL
ncbi:hypothetical protein [Brevibacterium aurantiacum]|uniref:Uncharacterized protein n=1 Tax=Brevibacterium aurantiacum TaxID=273384 RepID=A0A556CCF2_BREAU|nr:hypothetical protein [Brevibacterium aurantiacum]TSI15111.1 hypothetical protein FO013_13930 [Brevibacterium aurantiacum]